MAYPILQELVTLVEGRVDFAITQFGKKVGAALQDDTSAKKPDTAEKMIQALADISLPNVIWLCRMYAAKQFKFEDLQRTKQTINDFEKVKKKLADKNLNGYKTMNDLYDAIEPFQNNAEDLSQRELEKRAKAEGVVTFLDKPDLKVIIPKIEAAACLYGKGTKWCTAAKENNQFKHYDDQGDLLILLVPDLDGKPRKFQLHYQTDSFMDERDQTVSQKDITALSKLPGYTEFLNKLIKKHYGPHIEALKPQ
jgi:hypothetical protein